MKHQQLEEVYCIQGSDILLVNGYEVTKGSNAHCGHFWRQCGKFSRYVHKNDWTRDPIEALRLAEFAKTRELEELIRQRSAAYEVADALERQCQAAYRKEIILPTEIST